MAEDLGMIACRAMDKAWSLPANESWQAVADAVVAAHEARRWKPMTEEALLHATPVLVGRWHRGAWCWKQTYFVAVAIEDGYTHWQPIPAPPQEVSDAGK